MNNQASENVSQTIDAYGNIINKPYGVSRWANPKKYACAHTDCENIAVALNLLYKVHNCCGEHDESEGL